MADVRGVVQVFNAWAENNNQKTPIGRAEARSCNFDPMPFSVVQRLLHPLTPRSLRPGGPMRLGICPPLAHPRTGPWPQRLRDWFLAGFADRSVSTALRDWRPSAHRDAALVEGRNAFRAALADIATVQAAISLDHIRAARSLHELWHLRTEVFSLVSRHHNQVEADRRLSLLDRHFPSRTRRTGVVTPASKDGYESIPPS